MLCQNCNKENIDDAKFCLECGTLLISETKSLNNQLKESVKFLNERKLKEASDLLFALNNKYPSNAAILNNIGYMFLLKGDKRESINWFKKALKIDPNFKVAQENLKLANPAKEVYNLSLNIFMGYIAFLFVISTIFTYYSERKFDIKQIWDSMNNFSIIFFFP